MKPDFALTDLSPLSDQDLAFLIERFPQPGKNFAEIASVLNALPNTLESLLDSEFVLQALLERKQLLLGVSPFLLFNVLLRRTLSDHRSRTDRRVVNYLANLLSLFVRTDRLYRIAPADPRVFEYLVDLIEAQASSDKRQQFLIHAHIGNYALFLTGLFPAWIDYRHRFQRRPVDRKFYCDFGRAYYHQAAGNPLAGEFGLDDVFLRLALTFDRYVGALNRMREEYFAV